MAAITIVQLRAFIAVAQTQHFGEAAARIGVSQPTLSQALATLEANLDVQLIERSSRRILITAAGARLLPLAQRAVDAVDDVVEAAVPVRWLSGPMRLGVIPTIAPYLLPAVLRTLRREAPDLELAVHEDQTWRLVDALKRGELDLAILALPVRAAGLSEIPLYTEDFVLAVPADSDLGGRTDLDPAVLQGLHLLLLDEGHCLRDQALEVCVQAGVREAGADSARASSLATIVQLVSAGLGSTLLPATAVPAEARGAALGIAHFREPAPGRTIGLVHRASTRGQAELEDLADILRRAVVRGRLAAELVTPSPG
jgi:LysR family hydrogen peroxide-inducible transcriptional activator